MIAVLALSLVLATASSLEAQTSLKLAESLPHKIDAMKSKQAALNGKPEFAEVSKLEVESYIPLLVRQKKIPAKVDSVDVQFVPVDVALDTQLVLARIQSTHQTGPS
jgi:hypothetical protein